jgi:hypothetical protein
MAIAPAMQMYPERAVWWPLLSAPADYAEEAAVFVHMPHDDD